ncbi:MAG TPA: lipopolysaccharide kinase InaA family protein [Burkholderiales bacterium]|nr:lipopolysaccharide kinase InaA family protein [Burkholderiales bacterium]
MSSSASIPADPAELSGVGPYAGRVADAYRAPDLLAALAGLPALLAAPAARLVATGRNRNLRVELPVHGRRVAVMVKAFGAQSWLRDLRDLRRGSKARRTWQAATHLAERGVGTPPPIAFLERWEGARLRESYYLAEFQDGATTFREALLELFERRPPLAAQFVQLLECVAAGVRRMHDAGFLHNDLGNQNVLLRPGGDAAWRDFMLVDLNRGRVRPALGLRQRGRDLSRLELPSDLLQILVEMYWRGTPPRALLGTARLYRRLYGLQVLKRRLLQVLRGGAREAPGRDYPAPRELWIWDEPTAQPISALLRRDRARLFPLSRYRRVLVDGLRAAPGVWREYRALRRAAYAHPVQFAGRIGMALEPTPATREQELALLAGLGRIPALVRFYHHDDAARRAFRVELVHALHRAGHPVAAALVQDRRALREPASWRAFAREVLERIAPVVQEVEVGHAINRVKWGVWGFEELRALYAPLPDLQSRFPALRFMGPAAIDFEYPAVFPALREWPRAVPLAALSHHLYVDRRGAPENPQDGFGAPEKFALGRAAARASGAARFIVSEVNWPLHGMGAQSPIHAPYFPPWRQASDPGVGEEQYGDYLLRYLCLALGSGMVERVYWWRLAARGYGLADDAQPAALRPRPAYFMLRHFLALLGDATLLSARLPARRGERHGRYRFAFRRADGEIVALTYAHGPGLPFPADDACARVEDAFGETAAPAGLGGRPVYLRGARA